MKIDTVNKAGRCIVCDWLTVTAVPMWGGYVYCCDDRSCKLNFKDAIMASVKPQSVYHQGE